MAQYGSGSPNKSLMSAASRRLGKKKGKRNESGGTMGRRDLPFGSAMDAPAGGAPDPNNPDYLGYGGQSTGQLEGGGWGGSKQMDLKGLTAPPPGATGMYGADVYTPQGSVNAHPQDLQGVGHIPISQDPGEIAQAQAADPNVIAELIRRYRGY